MVKGAPAVPRGPLGGSLCLTGVGLLPGSAPGTCTPWLCISELVLEGEGSQERELLLFAQHSLNLRVQESQRKRRAGDDAVPHTSCLAPLPAALSPERLVAAAVAGTGWAFEWCLL